MAKKRMVQFRIDEDEYATFMINSHEKGSKGAEEVEGMIKIRNRRGGKKHTYADWIKYKDSKQK